MTFTRGQAVWSGAPGLPGYTNFHFFGVTETPAEADALAVRMRAFFLQINGFMSNAVTVSIRPIFENVNEVDGRLQSEVTATTVGAPVAGNYGGTLSAAAGAVVNWNTSTIQFGRRVRGRTFLVPMGGGLFAADGTLETTSRNTLQDAAAGLALAAPVMVVWSRPREAAVGPPAEPARLGTVNLVTGVTVPDLAAVLRSRRD